MHSSAQHVLLTISLLTCLGATLYLLFPRGGPEVYRRKRMRRALSMLLGALYGLGFRLMLMVPHLAPVSARLLPEPVSLAFLVMMPFAVGAIAVYFGEEDERLSVSYQFAAPALDIVVFLSLTALSFLEGTICIVMAMPIFLVMAIVGGLLMGLVLRLSSRGGTVVRCAVMLPLLAAPLENALGNRDEVHQMQLRTVIHASPAVIWGDIKNARDIRPDELGTSWVYSIGVPRPEEGLTRQTPEGEVRWSRWSQGVRFKEKILAQIPDRSILWDFHFDDSSIPPGVLDEHVRIGGRYFDLVDTRYDIQPLDGGNSELTLTAHYRVSTAFNGYAALWAGWMLRDAGATVLHFYKHRSEADEARSQAQGRMELLRAG